jgi:ribosomal protein S7
MLERTPSSQALPLPENIRTRAKGLRPLVRTVGEAIGLIDRELPVELRSLPRWTFARALLVQAERSRKKRDLICAARQLRQALSNEGWLAEAD